MNNGYYFHRLGKFDTQVINATGSKSDVYIYENKIGSNYMGIKKFPISYAELINKAKTIFGESSAYRSKGISEELSKEMHALASVYERNKKAYGATSVQAKLFADTPVDKRNGTTMQLAIAAVIHAQMNGYDYSFGATHWDGMEQATAFPMGFKERSNGKFEAHRNTWGWNISEEHYDKWKKFIGKDFVDVGRIHPATVGINKGKIRATSTAVYNGTIFWLVK